MKRVTKAVGLLLILLSPSILSAQNIEDIEALKRENQELKKRIRELAQELIRLRQLLMETSPSLPKETVPETTLRGRIFLKRERILIKPGADGGVKVGDRFYVIHQDKVVATVEVEKVLNRFAFVRVVEGDQKDIHENDEIIGYILREQDKQEPLPQIKSVIGKDTFIINYGLRHGVQQGDEVDVYDRSKRIKARLEVYRVESESAFAKLLGKAVAPVNVGDRVVIIKSRPKIIVGFVKKIMRDQDKIRVILDIGSERGVRKGQVYEVKRASQTICELRIEDVKRYSSVAQVISDQADKLKEKDTVYLKPRVIIE
jgi:hypothetical protein